MGPVSSFAYDPVDSNVIYAVSKGLFRSGDKGETWKIVYPSSDNISRVVSKGDEAEETIVTTDEKHSVVTSFAIDPFDPHILYAVISEDGNEIFSISHDSGQHWRKEKSGVKNIKNIYVWPTSTGGQNKIILTGVNSIHLWENGVWTTAAMPLGVTRFMQFEGGYDNAFGKFILYAIGEKSKAGSPHGGTALFYSDDEGRTWKNRDAGVLKFASQPNASPQWRCIGISRSKPATIYLSFSQLPVAKDTMAMGIAKSTDFGQSWNISWKDLLTKHDTVSDAHYSGAWIDERFGPMWGENPFCFGVFPGDPDICYTTDYGRVTKTVNGGRHWEQCYTQMHSDGSCSTTGLDITTGYGIVMDPFDSTHQFLPTTDVGLMESVNSGVSWKSATKNNGIPEAWVNTTYSLVFDNLVKGKAWAAMSYVHDLPRAKMFREADTRNYDGGIVMTLDAGKSWKMVSSLIGPGAVTDLLIDSASPANRRTIYACVFGKGVYKSVDDGHTWLKKTKGITETEPFCWRIIKNPRGTHSLMLVVSRGSNEKVSGSDGAVYFSADGAESWQRLQLPGNVNGPTCIAADPDHPQRLLLTAWGRPQASTILSDTSGGIFLSENNGKSWANVLSYDQHMQDVTIDWRNKTWYACGFNSAAYRSADGGKSWTRIAGYDFKWAQRVNCDPRDSSRIYISTFGGGVWWGPAVGDTTAHEHLFSPPFHP
jgi:photosystem II stability/assembly factor-like uncharacterized protein